MKGAILEKGRQVWRRFWRDPDAAMLVAGGEGERQVAYVRVVVVALLMITPVYRLFINPSNAEVIWGFIVTLLAMTFALFVQFYLRHRPYRPWLGYLTTCVDGTLVSGALLLFVIVGSPLSGVNDKITFEVYFLVLMAIALRHDRRICVLVGSLVVLQYASLLWYVNANYDLKALSQLHHYSGTYSPADQWTRLILLSSAVFISYAFVAKSETLVNRAIRDPLTGLLNRGFFDTLFSVELERARRYGQQIAVVILDADHFKQINDTYGHSAGDAVLKVLATTLHNGVRESDIVVRYGGEEFVILLHEIGVAAAREKMESLRQGIEKLAVRASDHKADIRFTVSAGIAFYPDDGTLAHELLSCADSRLMRAKQTGRNRVVSSDAAS
ncbi:MAG: GGDEF domain-containing protein [Betaproteobacteria bacterium]